MLKIGDKMPDFQVQDQDGRTVSSKDLLGKKTIIYFYPKDNTSGCTAEACNLRDNYDALVAAGYNVVAISWGNRVDFLLDDTALLTFRSPRRSRSRLRLRLFRKLLFRHRRDDDIGSWNKSRNDIIRHGTLLTQYVCGNDGAA